MDATHICGICGALWIQWPDDSAGCPAGSWSLRSPKAGSCCDNVEMGLQIIPLAEVDEFVREFDGKREWAAACLYSDRKEQAERDARGNCGKCKHFKPDPDAGIRYHGEPHPAAGYCQHHGGDGNGPCIMLSGDWCGDFEAKQ